MDISGLFDMFAGGGVTWEDPKPSMWHGPGNHHGPSWWWTWWF